MDKTNVIERVENLSEIIVNNLFPDIERGTGLGVIIPNAANIPSGVYERQVSKIFDKLNLKNQDKTIGKALDLLEGMVNTKTFENIAKQASAEVWEAAAENLAKSGNKSKALAKLTSETYESLSAKIANNSQIIADAAADMSKLSKLASGLNLVGKHFGSTVAGIDLAMAIRSDDLNAVVKAATLTAVGMVLMPTITMAGASFVAAIVATTVVTAFLAASWDFFKIGDWLGITGESFLEREKKL